MQENKWATEGAVAERATGGGGGEIQGLDGWTEGGWAYA